MATTVLTSTLSPIGARVPFQKFKFTLRARTGLESAVI